MKLLIRGGSIAAGIGAQRCYADIQQKRISDFEIINRSRIRDNAFHAIRTFYQDIDHYRPDILIIRFGMDDAYQAVYRSEFKENLVQMVRLARNRYNPDIILLTSHPFEEQYEIDMIYAYYRVIQDMAKDLECMYVPTHAFWFGALSQSGASVLTYLQKDIRYPSELGHEVYAQAVSQKLIATYLQ